MKLSTKIIHSGLGGDQKPTGSVITPIFQTSTYVQKSPGKNLGYEYSRSANPTRKALEKNISSIENARYGFCFGSGMAAIDGILRLLRPGDEIICSNDIYGGTFRLFNQIYAKQQYKFIFSDLQSTVELEKLHNKRTKMIWIETPSNPMMNIIDIKMVTDFTKKKKILTVVDNTFASPFLQNPIDYGADIVTHSATKYLGGHSDVVLGSAVTNKKKIADELYLIQKSCGAIPGPMDCFLTLRGIKTLHIRMERHCYNAKKIAEFLTNHKMIEKVFWPGLKSHPNHKIAKKQMRDFGGMISFKLKKNSLSLAKKFLSNLKLFTLAESLGGVESLISHPSSMTHASLSDDLKEKNNITDSLIRISVGIENHEDLINDLSKSFNKLK
ncbi:MAG: cystathionine gamma-synthase [Flavobacteriales bacterium]|nr:cystathionine gamma-synthase [Flavobacteriales bacterium]|tara:strand:- start:3110 stop:4261 length:1152 start_codon:yes stop_codon:yes gene_type:complete